MFKVFLLALFFVNTLFGCALCGKSPPIVRVALTLDTKEGRLQDIAVRWVFDATVSAQLLKSADKNGDGKLQPNEVKSLEHDFEEIKQYDYFSKIFINGKEITIKKIKEFNAVYQDGVVTYSYKIIPGSPVLDWNNRLNTNKNEPLKKIDIYFVDPLNGLMFVFDSDNTGFAQASEIKAFQKKFSFKVLEKLNQIVNNLSLERDRG